MEKVDERIDIKNNGLAKKEYSITLLACSKVKDLFKYISLVYFALEGKPDINDNKIVDNNTKTKIKTDRFDLLKFFYRYGHIKYLLGQSISWPYPKEFVARISFALETKAIVTAFYYMNKCVRLLEE